MSPENHRKLERRVRTAAEAALKARGYTTAIDVLLGIGWLDADAHSRWRKGQVPYLERAVGANLKRISTAMRIFRSWAAAARLKPIETQYRHRGRTLRFSKSGHPEIERLYRTHWVSARLCQAKRDGSAAERPVAHSGEFEPRAGLARKRSQHAVNEMQALALHGSESGQKLR